MKRRKGQSRLSGISTSDLVPDARLLRPPVKPISHTLGLRATETLFSPYSCTTPAALEEGGYECRRAALWEDARTQYKTAQQLGDIVQGARQLCKEGYRDDDVEALGGFLREAERAAKSAGEGKHKDLAARSAATESIRSMLSESIKGTSPGPVKSFCAESNTSGLPCAPSLTLAR